MTNGQHEGRSDGQGKQGERVMSALPLMQVAVGLETIICTGVTKNLVLYPPSPPPTTHYLSPPSHALTLRRTVIFSQQAVETPDRKIISALMEENDFTNAQADSNGTSIKGTFSVSCVNETQ